MTLKAVTEALRERRLPPHSSGHQRKGADAGLADLTHVAVMIVVTLFPRGGGCQRKAGVKPKQPLCDARVTQDRAMHVVVVGNECPDHQQRAEDRQSQSQRPPGCDAGAGQRGDHQHKSGNHVSPAPRDGFAGIGPGSRQQLLADTDPGAWFRHRRIRLPILIWCANRSIYRITRLRHPHDRNLPN